MVAGVQAYPRPERVRSWALVEAARRAYCENCWSVKGPFHVHHIVPRGAGGGDEPQNLISLCWECHMKVHSGLLVLGSRRPEPPALDLLVQAWCAQAEDAEEGRWAQAAIAFVLVDGMGMSPKAAASELGCSPALVRQLCRTFQAFPEPSSRVPELSFRHHQIAAGTGDPEGWIRKALGRGWSTRQFEQAVRDQSDPVDVESRLRRRAERLVREVKELLTSGGEAAGWLRAELGRVLTRGCERL